MCLCLFFLLSLSLSLLFSSLSLSLHLSLSLSLSFLSLTLASCCSWLRLYRGKQNHVTPVTSVKKRSRGRPLCQTSGFETLTPRSSYQSEEPYFLLPSQLTAGVAVVTSAMHCMTWHLTCNVMLFFLHDFPLISRPPPRDCILGG